MSALVDFETIPQLITRLVAHYEGQNRTVLRYKDRKTKAWVDISWEALWAKVQAMAGYLHKAGVRPGDRVAILSENRPEWAMADMATQSLGGVNVSLYTTLPRKFCFQETPHAPQFIRKEKAPRVRKALEEEAVRWHVLWL